jgi:hypothetical protein
MVEIKTDANSTFAIGGVLGFEKSLYLRIQICAIKPARMNCRETLAAINKKRRPKTKWKA